MSRNTGTLHCWHVCERIYSWCHFVCVTFFMLSLIFLVPFFICLSLFHNDFACCLPRVMTTRVSIRTCNVLRQQQLYREMGQLLFNQLFLSYIITCNSSLHTILHTEQVYVDVCIKYSFCNILRLELLAIK